MSKQARAQGIMGLAGLVVAVVSTVALALAGDASSLPEGDGRLNVAAACVSCHDLSVVTDKRMSRRDWEASVNAMVDRGLSLSKEQASTIVTYLTKNFGPADGGADLVVEICSTCHELERIREQHWTKDEWREETKGMISEGAAVSDEDVDLMLNYLARNFGRKADQ